jgi:predicted ATPase
MYSEQFRQIFLDSYRTSSLLTGRNIPRSVHLELMREFVERIVTMKEIFDRSGGNFESLLVDGRIRRPLIDDFLDRCSNILKGRYIIASGGIEKIRISSGRHIELGRASSGQQSVIRLLQELAILIAQNRYTYRTIEEPEAHLFPAAQYHLTELMLMCHNLTQSEFLLTTHSPYFVATFNNALYASKAAQFDNSEVTNIGYPPHLRLNPDNFAAYQVQNGRATSIYQSDEALTSIDGLDAVSYDIGQKFSRLAEIVQLNEVLSV